MNVVLGVVEVSRQAYLVSLPEDRLRSMPWRTQLTALRVAQEFTEEVLDAGRR